MSLDLKIEIFCLYMILPFGIFTGRFKSIIHLKPNIKSQENKPLLRDLSFSFEIIIFSPWNYFESILPVPWDGTTFV